MDYVYVTKENIEQEHIYCAISSNSEVQVRSKKDWLTDRFEDGLVFIKSSVRGKCFIEYFPTKNAWIPLWYLSFKDSVSPKFKSCAKDCHIDELGFVLYYTNQCPFNAKYVPVIENVSKDLNIAFKAIHLDTKEKAQNAPTPITTYALFYNGEYVTNDVMNEKKFIKPLSNLGL